MIICPNCQAENRTGAKFCKNCAARLPDLPANTRPVDAKPAGGASTIRLDSSAMVATSPPKPSRRTDTLALPATPALTRRPVGAIFGDGFLYRSLTFSDDQQNHYQVSPILSLESGPENYILVCPNSACGAFFPPRLDGAEKYCTDCGTVLTPLDQDLMLFETTTPITETVRQIILKGLSHSSLRVPLVAFDEELLGGKRYCLVTPLYNVVETRPEMPRALRWGVELGRGMDYLHDNGVWFGGHLDASCFGLVGERMVWVNLNCSQIHPDDYVTDRQTDVRALAAQVFYWLTGKNNYERDTVLLPAVNRIFEQAFGPAGYASGREFADALEQIAQDSSASQAVDYRLGRRTNVGMVRTLNEDSVLTIETNRIQQSVSQPLGVYIVADGMGGHAAGEVASSTIVNAIAQKALTDLFPTQVMQSAAEDRSDWLRQAVETANKAVYDLRKSAGTDMGSTLVSVVLDGNKAYVAHVGDSRVYLVNVQGIRQLTTDHSLVERLVATHQITREEARHHPQRNVVYRTVGDKAKVEVELTTHTLKPGDFVLLCSDGLSGMVEDTLIHQIVMNAASPQAACDELIAAANAAGGEDNISAVIVEIVQA